MKLESLPTEPADAELFDMLPMPTMRYNAGRIARTRAVHSPISEKSWPTTKNGRV
jgi:hypothetical protein